MIAQTAGSGWGTLITIMAFLIIMAIVADSVNKR